LRAELKAAALRRGRTVTDLLTEGARLVLERYRGAEDQETLRARAAVARERLREGVYRGKPVSDSADDEIYGAG
jgi:hypothetical protein